MEDVNFLIQVMFWTIIAIMLVILYVLKEVKQTQKYLASIDKNIEKMVRQVLIDEERILDDLEGPHTKKTKKLSKK